MLAKGRGDDAALLSGLTADTKSRDLVVELLYQGRADLDLIVTEPTGSVCSATHKRTTNGGLLVCDILEQRDDNRSEVYTAALAFPGRYDIRVRKVLGNPIDNRARIKVTKHAGTPSQSVEVFSVELTADATVSVNLENGGRKDLVTVLADAREAQLESTPAIDDNLGPTGGVGDRFSATQTLKPKLPATQPMVESRLPGIAAGSPGMRFETKLASDRKNVVVSAKPVFVGTATDIPVPKIGLLPKSGR